MSHRTARTDTDRLVRLAEARRQAASGELRRRRKSLNLGLDDCAGPVGVSVPTLSRWERGGRISAAEPALRYVDLLDQLERRLSLRSAS